MKQTTFHNITHCTGRDVISHSALSAFKENMVLNATFVFLCANEQNYKFHRSLVLITVEEEEEGAKTATQRPTVTVITPTVIRKFSLVYDATP